MCALLIGVLAEPDLKTATDVLSQNRSLIDGVELRLDYFNKMDHDELKSWMSQCGLPVMLTLRHQDQGGLFSGSEQERLDLIEAVCALRPAYVDLEYDVPMSYRKRLFEAYPEICFLSSLHDFSATPENLEEVFQKIKTPYAHVYKIATTAQSSLDALRLLSFIQKHSKANKMIGIAMGEEGKPTRILAPVVGSFLTYARLSTHGSTAAGQFSAQELQEVYHFRALNPKTSIFALIGDPIDKSLGALIHNAVFQDAQLNAVYIKMRVQKKEVADFFAEIRNLPFKGFSITMPLKEEVMPHLKRLSAQVKEIGACNTIKVEGEGLCGYNTDGVGGLDALEKKMRVAGKSIVFIGAGGASKALIYEAALRGAKIAIVNRTPQKALAMAAQVGGRGGGYESMSNICAEGYDMIVNCTPQDAPFDQAWILPGVVAMDIVYVPKDTAFLLSASHNHCQLVFGYEMFTFQALEQELLWFPGKIDRDRAARIIELYQNGYFFEASRDSRTQ